MKVYFSAFLRNLSRISLVFILVSLLINLAYRPVFAQSTNLINNNSVETASSDPTIPSGWNTGNWGTNSPIFEYLNEGSDGTKSIKVSMSNYTSGDAKWYFNPVTISPSTSYFFSDYYKSNISTDIVAEITTTSNTKIYQYIGTATANTNWTLYGNTFVTPANAQSITVFHLISSNGYLQTDNYTLRLANTATITNGVPNNSVEVASDSNPNMPLAWNKGNWGTNSPIFTYSNTAHSGLKGLRVDMNSYTDGDAKWYYDSQPVTPNKDYLFTDYFMSNVDTQIIAEVLNTDNTYSYVSLLSVSPQSTWTQAKVTYSASSTAKSVTIFHLINRVGYLLTDDYTFTPFTRVGFNRAIVSLNFDDGWRNTYNNGLPILNRYGLKSTQFIVSSFVGTSGYVTPTMVKNYKAQGHEIGSHTVDHQDLTTLSNDQINTELSQSKQYLENLIGTPVTDFASPYGTYDDNVISIAKNYYKSYRTTSDGYNFKTDYDQYRIKTQNITNTTTPAQVQAWVNQAIKDKTWLILVYHQISDNNANGEYNTRLNALDTELKYIKSTGVKVSTMSDAISEINPQL